MSHYKGGGTTGYYTRMLLKVLFYSYLSNVYSCRKTAKALDENIHFMYISGNSTPDFRTINSFREQILKEHIHDLFAELVKMLVAMGYVSIEVQYVDGTNLTFFLYPLIPFFRNKALLDDDVELLPKNNVILSPLSAIFETLGLKFYLSVSLANTFINTMG